MKPDSIRCVLVTRLRFLGDVVLCTPLLEALREALPAASIEFLGMPPHVDVLRHHHAVDQLHRLEPNASPARMVAMARQLRARKPDVAIDLFGNPRSALLCFASGAKLRVGPARGLRSRLYTHRRDRPDGDRSAIRHHLDKLIPIFGRSFEPTSPRLVVSDEERRAIRSRLGLDEGQRVFIAHPGSTWPDKAWPEKRWSEVFAALEGRDSHEVLVIDPPAQRGLASELCRGTRARALEPLELRALLALLTHADLYVGNDGGILHAAVALEVPSVGLFGPTEPDIWFPYEHLGPYRVIHRCGPERVDAAGVKLSRLGAITVEEVLDAIDDVLRRWTGAET